MLGYVAAVCISGSLGYLIACVMQAGKVADLQAELSAMRDEADALKLKLATPAETSQRGVKLPIVQ